MFRKILSYLSIGVFNTLIHWGAFTLFVWFLDQSLSNLISFGIAATISFFLNAKYTFREKTNISKYIMFLSAMGGVAYFVGFISDKNDFHPFFTLIVFSTLSTIIGFVASYFIFEKSK